MVEPDLSRSATALHRRRVSGWRGAVLPLLFVVGVVQVAIADSPLGPAAEMLGGTAFLALVVYLRKRWRSRSRVSQPPP
jgi:uncharacterized membrane protein